MYGAPCLDTLLIMLYTNDRHVYLQNLAYQQEAQNADAGYASEDTEPLDEEMVAALADADADADTEGVDDMYYAGAEGRVHMSGAESDLSSGDDVPLVVYAESMIMDATP